MTTKVAMFDAERNRTMTERFQAYDPSILLPGAATVLTCLIHVPYRHRLRRAWLSNTDVDNVGAVTADLRQLDDGDAKAATKVGTTLSDAQLAATSDVLDIIEFTLAAGDKTTVAANRHYCVALIGTDADDRIQQPTLLIEVEPEIENTL